MVPLIRESHFKRFELKNNQKRISNLNFLNISVKAEMSYSDNVGAYSAIMDNFDLCCCLQECQAELLCRQLQPWQRWRLQRTSESQGGYEESCTCVSLIVIVSLLQEIKLNITLAKRSDIIAIGQERCNSVRWVINLNSL